MKMQFLFDARKKWTVETSKKSRLKTKTTLSEKSSEKRKEKKRKSE